MSRGGGRRLTDPDAETTRVRPIGGGGFLGLSVSIRHYHGSL